MKETKHVDLAPHVARWGKRAQSANDEWVAHRKGCSACVPTEEGNHFCDAGINLCMGAFASGAVYTELALLAGDEKRIEWLEQQGLLTSPAAVANTSSASTSRDPSRGG